jgi:cytochrome c553
MYLDFRALFFAVFLVFAGVTQAQIQSQANQNLPNQTQPQADTMAKRMQACTTCHGAQGIASNQAYFPRIAGKPAGYLFNQLVNFKEGRRHYGLMVGMVEHLSDAYLLEMAQYFADLDLPYATPAPLKMGAAQSALELGKILSLQGDKTRHIPACISCHGTALMGVQPAMPALLGLPKDYISAQLGAWQTGLRRSLNTSDQPDCMRRIAQLLSPADVDAVANWLATQPVPAANKPAVSLPSLLSKNCGGVK